jgi:hypothetical protein
VEPAVDARAALLGQLIDHAPLLPPAEMTPPDALAEDQRARFIRSCRARGLVFKATAGLHHAVRRDGGHGLLNLLAAVVFGDEEEALGEKKPAAFALTSDAFVWRGRSAGPDELGAARRALLHSVGSCSFFEPVEELGALGMLPR